MQDKLKRQKRQGASEASSAERNTEPGPTVKLHLLGTPSLSINGVKSDLPLTRPVWLLLYLGYYGEWISREALAFFFRPDADEGDARRYIRKLLHEAQKIRGTDGLEVEPERLRWRVPTDVGEFQAAIQKGGWFEARGLYRGPFLDSLNAATSPSFEAWLDFEREALARALHDASLHYANDLESSGHHSDAAEVAKELLQRDALAEDALQTYLCNAYLSGQREAALEAAAAFKEELRGLGFKPLAATEETIETVRQSRPLQKRPNTRTYGRRSTDRPQSTSDEAELGELLTLMEHTNARLMTITDVGGRGQEALIIAKRVPEPTVALRAVANLAERLIGSGHHTRAMELLVLALLHPACDADTKEKVQQALRWLEPHLPKDLVRSALAR